jgi:hypothetical protein
MIEWFALLVFVGLVAWSLRETFVDTEFTSGGSTGVPSAVTRPSLENGGWKSKIDAQVPIGANDEDYVKVLQAFYDKVYEPAPLKPTTAQLEAFLAGPDVNGVPVDTGALRLIIVSAFHLDAGKTAAAKEQDQIKFSPTKNLEPAMGRDEVYVRDEDVYKPSDSRRGGPVPEGYYAPLKQQAKPRRVGEANYASVGKTGVQFYDVCSETRAPGCEENVL